MGEGGSDADEAHRSPVFDVITLRPRWARRPIMEDHRASAKALPEKIVVCGWEAGPNDELGAALCSRTELILLDCRAAASPAEQFTHYASELFAIAKCVLAGKPTEPVRLQLLVLDAADKAYLCGLAAFFRTVQQESSRLKGQTIIVDEPLGASAIVRILEENFPDLQDTLVRYEKGARLVQRWEEVCPATTPSCAETASFRNDGVYLITGGLGGLGLIMAKEIARQAPQATVVLTGRSALSKRVAEQLASLSSSGATVVYRTSDITRREAVEDLIAAIQKEFGRLSGIMHAAGVVMDRYVVNKSPDDFAQVMAPKVAGLWFLDEATKALDLEFLLPFSSVSGARGNAGQADYALGNAFMDFYASYRNDLVAKGQRRGRTVALDWPLWAEGGMDVSDKVKEFLRKKFHLAPLPTVDGLEVLTRAVQASDSQWLIYYGDPQRVRETILQ